MTTKINLKTIFIVTTFFLFFSCVKQEKRVSVSAKTSNETLPTIQPSTEKLANLSKGYIIQKRIPAKEFCDNYWKDDTDNLSFLVARNGQIIYEKYNGFGNLETKTKMDQNTSLHIASVSKVLTATAILLLIDAGKIELDQKVTTILENFPYPKITIKTLLNHRSGLRNYAYFTDDKTIWDSSKTLTNQAILNLFTEKNLQLDYPTDTRFCYCNTNYAMLALIIEKVTKTTYKDAMKRMIFNPLGMKNTYVFDIEKDVEKITPSYRGNGSKFAIDFLDGVYGDKNIYSTPRDLLKFDMAINATTFLNPALKKKMYQGYSYESKGEKNYGLGIRMIEWKTGQKYYFHNGWWHGNTSSFVTLKNERVAIIALSNRFTRNVYTIRKLAPLFGDYPFVFNDGEE